MDPRYNKMQKQREIGDDTVLDCFLIFGDFVRIQTKHEKSLQRESEKIL